MSEAKVKEAPTGLALLREPFPDNQISKLPKPTISNEEWKKLPKARCTECGGYHATSRTIHLDYVGHAALTDRLLDADPAWTWEPVAICQDGSPMLDENGGMWIKLTVCGVTRLGYGDAQGKTGGNAMKERIGDALRNAAMRFGAALELWHKGDLHANGEDEPEAPKEPRWKSEKVDALKLMTEEQMERIRKCVNNVFDCLNANEPHTACEVIDECNFDMEEKLALWTFFDSTQRASLKKSAEARRKAALVREEASQA